MSWRGPELPTADDYVRDSSIAKLAMAGIVAGIGTAALVFAPDHIAGGIISGAVLYAAATALGWTLQTAIDRWLTSSGGVQVGAYIVKLILLAVGVWVINEVASDYLISALLTFVVCVVLGLLVDAYVFLSRPVPALDIPERDDVGDAPSSDAGDDVD